MQQKIITGTGAFILYIDGINTGLEVALHQIKDLLEFPIQFSQINLNQAQRRYLIVDKECLEAV